MENFIERVGQSYLERKAFAVPQQLENIAKKQLTGGAEQGANAKELAGKKIAEEDEGGEKKEKRTTKKASGKAARHASSVSSEQDQEIARLKKQLAQLKLEKSKASSRKGTLELNKSGISRASNGQKALAGKAAKGDKGTKELAASGLARAAGGRHLERKSKSRSKSGEKEASGSKVIKEANMVEISPTPRRTSTSQHGEHDVGAPSEHGSVSKSEHGGRAGSTTSHSAAASSGGRSQSIASHSERGSTTRSIAPGPVHEYLPEHPDWHGEERAVVESRRGHEREEQERDLYAIEVEEEGGKDMGGVVEVESSQGRMVYRID